MIKVLTLFGEEIIPEELEVAPKRRGRQRAVDTEEAADDQSDKAAQDKTAPKEERPMGALERARKEMERARKEAAEKEKKEEPPVEEPAKPEPPQEVPEMPAKEEPPVEEPAKPEPPQEEPEAPAKEEVVAETKISTGEMPVATDVTTEVVIEETAEKEKKEEPPIEEPAKLEPPQEEPEIPSKEEVVAETEISTGETPVATDVTTEVVIEEAAEKEKKEEPPVEETDKPEPPQEEPPVEEPAKPEPPQEEPELPAKEGPPVEDPAKPEPPQEEPEIPAKEEVADKQGPPQEEPPIKEPAKPEPPQEEPVQDEAVAETEISTGEMPVATELVTEVIIEEAAKDEEQNVNAEPVQEVSEEEVKEPAANEIKEEVVADEPPGPDADAKAARKKRPIKKARPKNIIPNLSEPLVLKGWEPTKQYYPIGEVAELFNVATSHIRYWTNEFGIRVRTTKKGDRMYSADHIQVLRTIYHLTKERGFTLAGAKTKLKEDKKPAATAPPDMNASLLQLRKQLLEIREKLA